MGLLLLVSSLGACAVNGESGSARWQQTFADEFNGPQGERLDPRKWIFDIGGSGWGNSELQSYTDRPANVRLDGQGHLVIEAHREHFVGDDRFERDYTSGRIKTHGLFSQAFGRFEARMKLPAGPGLWPAFWLLGDEFPEAGWPECGEIDIMELVGQTPNRVHGTIHGPGYSGDNGLGDAFDHPDGLRFDQGFHVYAVEWEPDEIRWYVDDHLYQVRRPEDTAEGPWVFDDHFFIIMNLAVGGHLPGPPDETTPFPSQVLVDYVRVYKDRTLTVDQAELNRRREQRWQRYRIEQEKSRFRGVRRVTIPGLIEVENYQAGGEGVAYHDADAPNQGGDYRPDDGVDIQRCRDPDSYFNVGWTLAGEWLAYDVDVDAAGTYALEVSVACDGSGGQFRLEREGQTVAGPLTVPDTGGWQQWQVLTVDEVFLPAGPATLRLVMDSVGPESGVTGNFNWLRFTKTD